MQIVLYSDFGSAECYALNEVLATLRPAVAVLWRGVQVEPRLPVPMAMRERRALDRIEDELDDLRRRVPGLDATAPRGSPNTARAIVAVASVMRYHPVRAAAFRDEIFRAYWRSGADISIAAEVQRLADAAAVPRWVDLGHPDAEAEVAQWELDWATERLGGVPRAVRSDGRILWGLRSPDELAAFCDGG